MLVDLTAANIDEKAGLQAARSVSIRRYFFFHVHGKLLPRKEKSAISVYM